MTDLTREERQLLEWLKPEPGQYGECYGKTLDALIKKGLARVQGEESGLNNTFIAKGTSLMFRAVEITDDGREALTK